MTVQFYDKWLEKLWKGAVDADSGDIVCAALDGTYTFDAAAHEFASDLTGILGTSAPMTTKAFTAGVFTADQPSITGTSSGDHVQGLVYYLDTGTAGTSDLIGFDGEGPGGGAIDFTSGGNPITVVLQSGNEVARI